MISLFTFVKILNSSETRKSYPYEDNPYEITPSFTCFSLKGWIIWCFVACSRIQRSLLIDMKLLTCSSKVNRNQKKKNNLSEMCILCDVRPIDNGLQAFYHPW